MTASRWEDDRWLAQPLPLDMDFDSDEEPEPAAGGTPLHRRVYEQWWGRPWPVYREDDHDPDIPKTPDIADYQERKCS